MIEVMIAMTLLVTALSTAIGMLYSLNTGRRGASEEAVVQAIAQTLCEKVQGAAWDTLGKDVPSFADRNAWSWHRRATAQYAYPSGMNGFMSENNSDPTKDLKTLGLITSSTGVADIHVYLEYFKSLMLDHYNTLLSTVPNPRIAWGVECGNPITGARPSNATDINDSNVWLPEAVTGPASLDLSILPFRVVVARILISWTSVAGGTRWFELDVTRRQ